jgi:hypothetical protein
MLASLEISSGPLLLISDKKQEIEDSWYLGQSKVFDFLTEIPGCLLIDTTRFLISLVRGHVAMVVCYGG